MCTLSNPYGPDGARRGRIVDVKKDKRNGLTSEIAPGVIRWVSFSVVCTALQQP
jgi:hypothetical protein